MNVPTEQEARAEALRSVRLAKQVLAIIEVAEKACNRLEQTGQNPDLHEKLGILLKRLAKQAQNLYDRAVFYSSFYDASQES